MDNITPNKCLIVASGIQNHQEYVDLVKERLGELLPTPEHNFQREASEYIGGELRQWSETPATSITLAFESCPWASDDVPAYNVMAQLIGNSSNRHCRGRAVELAKSNNFVDGICATNSNFSDSGLFGITIEGSGSHSEDLMSVAVDQLNSLKEHISENELNQAKAALKMNIL